MTNYRRPWVAGATYFFTNVLRDRRENHLLVEHIDTLRAGVREVRIAHPFAIDGWVVLPEHMHCMLTLPSDDHDYAVRIRRIKSLFSQALPDIEKRSTVRLHRGQRGIWQNRYWEHLIKDQADYRAHMDYIHINPVKHGYVEKVIDWPYSTFHRLVRLGVYPANWAGDGTVDPEYPD